MSAPLPDRIGRYLIEAELGRGMMGVVYRARDPELDRVVALKTISLAFSIPEEEREAFEKRFVTEAKTAARLRHPAIVVVHDVGRDAETGALFIALEHLPGHTLEELIQVTGPLPWDEVARLGALLADGLHHAHASGVVHRDVKPANVMVVAPGEPKLMDFGVAKLVAGNLTTGGETFGTPLFMSPEQALGQAVDGRSDLFSLGAVLYVALTGRSPFEADSVPAILAKVAYSEPELPSRLRPGIPAELDDVVLRALAKRPEDRFADGDQLARALRQLVGSGSAAALAVGGGATRVGSGTLPAGGTVVAGTPALAPVRPGGPARSAVAAVLAVAVVAAGVFAAVVLRGGRPAATETSPATLGSSGGTSLQEPVEGGPSGPSAEAVPREPSQPASGSLAWSFASPGPTASLDSSTREVASSGVSPTPRSPAASSSDTPRAGAERVAPPSSRQPAPTARPRASAEGRRTSKLVVDFEHGIREGRFELWIDDDKVLDAALERPDGGKGSLQQILDAPAGEHRLRVVLRLEDGKEKIESLSTSLEADSTRQLEVRYGGLIKKLSLKLK